MRSHADDLNSGPLHRLATLIRDKQQVKKSYQSLHQQLESYNHKVPSNTERGGVWAPLTGTISVCCC